MDFADLLRLIVLLTSTGVLAGNVNQSAASSRKSSTFSNQFLTITISPGWEARSENQILDIIRGKYILSINPIFSHASGITGGRFPEIAARMPSVDAVMKRVDQPAGGRECSQADTMNVSSTISGSNYYTDKSKTGNGCNFPLDPHPAWFGSFFGDRSIEREHNITLSYDTADVNKLPKRGSQELRAIFCDVVAMLKTLRLKPPVVITKVDPEAAPPGAAVTIYGGGFRIPNYHASVIFTEFPNRTMLEPTAASDGNSLTFLVPSSIDTISCQPEYIDVNGNCAPPPANHVDIYDCPQPTDFCGAPMPPGKYQIIVSLDGTEVNSNSVAFTVAPSAPTPLSILLLYPNRLVLPGDMITVRGSGFAPTGNSVETGSAVVRNLSSLDGKTITFRAPSPTGETRIYQVFVSNAKGKSNSISLEYQ